MATSAEMVTLIKTALATNPVGVVRINVDGQDVTWDRKQALEELKFWQRESSKDAGTRRRAVSIYLGGF